MQIKLKRIGERAEVAAFGALLFTAFAGFLMLLAQ